MEGGLVFSGVVSDPGGCSLWKDVGRNIQVEIEHNPVDRAPFTEGGFRLDEQAEFLASLVLGPSI